MDVLGSGSRCCRFITPCIKQTFINCSSYLSNLLWGGINGPFPKVTAFWNTQKYGHAGWRWVFATLLPGKSPSSYKNGQLLSFSRKKAVVHVTENCQTLLGMYQPETCIRATPSQEALDRSGNELWKEACRNAGIFWLSEPRWYLWLGNSKAYLLCVLTRSLYIFSSLKCSKFMS